MANKEDFDPQGLSEDEITLLQSETEGDASPGEVEATAPGEDTTSTSGTEQSGEGEADKANPAANKPEGYVPNSAVREAREEARRYRDELQKMQSWQQQIADKLAERQTQTPVEAEAAPAVPDAVEDPVAAVQWVQKSMLEREERERKAADDQSKHQHQVHEWSNFLNYMNSEYDTAVAADESVKDAYDFAEQSYAAELKARAVPAHQIPQAIDAYRRDFAVSFANGVRDQGVSLGEYIKSIANTRGWQAKAAAPGAQTETAVEKIARHQEAVAANKTLSKGGAGNGEMTLEDLAAMSGEELEQLVGTNPELFAKLTGVPA